MLYLKFFIGDERYVIAINQITAITPYVYLNSIPLMPDYVAGLLNYQDRTIPVIDLCQLLISRSCVRMLSTRIIVTTINSSKGNSDIAIGFLVENATETFSVDEGEFVQPGMSNPDAPFIGRVVNDDEGMITRISPQDVFEKLDVELFYPQNISSNCL